MERTEARGAPVPRHSASAQAALSRLTAAAGGYLEEAASVLRAVAQSEADRVGQVSALLADRLRLGRVLFTCGNGGSAADAQHVAAELSGKFFLTRPGLAAVALTTNTSALTAIANDFSFDEVFVRQLSGMAHPGDVLMAFTTSGRSPNVRRACDWASEHGVTTVAFVGAVGREWAEKCDYAFVVPSEVTPHVQQAHITLGHAICALVEAELFGPQASTPETPGGASSDRGPHPR